MSVKLEEKPLSEQVEHIRGTNFSGTIRRRYGTAEVALTEFVEGKMFTLKLTDDGLAKYHSKYLFFTSLNKLYQELTENENMSIETSVPNLVIPIEISYKEHKKTHYIRLTLQRRKFETHQEHLKEFCLEFQRLSQLSGRLKKVRQPAEKGKEKHWNEQMRLVEFKKDISNSQTGRFETFISNRHLRLSNRDGTSSRFFTFNHIDPLPTRGKFYLKIREIGSAKRNIILGLGCARTLQHSDSHLHSGFSGYHLGEGKVYMEGRVVRAKECERGEVVEMRVDMSQGSIEWVCEGESLHRQPLGPSFLSLKLHPLVKMIDNGDEVQFLPE